MEIKLFKFEAGDWDKFEADLMNIETACYHQNLQWSKEDKKELFTSLDATIFLVEINNKVIGEALSSKLDFWNAEEFPSTKELSSKYKSNETCYQEFFSVLPGYQGIGIGKLLKKATIHEAQRKGYNFLLGHAKEGAAIEINKKFGARIIKQYEDWYGTGITHYLYEIDLKKVQ